MKLAFVADPLDEFKTEKDTTYAIMCEAAARGHELHAMQQEDLVWRCGTVYGRAARLHLTGGQRPWYRLEPAADVPLQEYDAVLMRKDPPFDMEYLYSTHLLELAQTQGARVFNRPQALRDYNEKLAIGRFPQFLVPSLVTRQAPLIREFLTEHQDIILKPLDGMGGSSIFRVHSGDYNSNVIMEMLTQDGGRTIMAQRFIPEISSGDKRVLIIDGEVVPYVLARIPKPGETRGNLAAGGTGVARPLTPRDREIAETLAPTLRRDGLLLVGLDIIGDYLTEVNVTSPTCFREITDQTGFNVAAMMVDALEKALTAA